jgi:hypothetical protein
MFQTGLEIDLKLMQLSEAFHCLFRGATGVAASTFDYCITDLTVAVDHIEMPLRDPLSKYPVPSFVHYSQPLTNNQALASRNFSLDGQGFLRGVVISFTRAIASHDVVGTDYLSDATFCGADLDIDQAISIKNNVALTDSFQVELDQL